MPEDQELARLRRTIVDTFRPLLDPAYPVALIDFPDSLNSGDHSIWLGEKALLDELQIEAVYQCSAATYSKFELATTVGSGTICMHGGGNFGDIYSLYHYFRLQVLKDFPQNPIVVFPQTIMFFSDEAMQNSVDAFSKHGNVTLAARDVLSLHILQRSFGHAAQVVLAPDMAVMLGELQRSCTPEYDVVCVSRTDLEGIYGPTIATVAGLTPLRQTKLDLGIFDDHLGITANAAVSGSRFLLSDWYQMRLPDQKALDAHQGLTFDQRSRVWVNRAVRLLSLGRVVVTDRLHGHILCTLAGIPHVLLNNSYGKNISYYETWSRPSRLCRLAATPPDAWSLAQQLLAHSPFAPTQFSTDVARWIDETSLHASWKHRSERAARFVASGSKLLDIGCGQMMIEKYLPEDCKYIPHDLVARDERTLVHDLNKNDRPPFDGATHISVLGVLEYLNDPEGFWSWLSESRARIVLSYVALQASFPADRRRAMGWFNHFSRLDIISMAERAGFVLVAEESIAPDTTLFVFDPSGV
jgi:exopolysaccharide biosynthesis predicted pyruvyltransferase EpsI